MTVYDSEVLSITSADNTDGVVLSRSKIDNEPGAQKARRAVITCFDANVAYRLDGEVPDPSTNEYHLLASGSAPLTIDGYNNLVNAVFRLVSGSTTAKIYVSYYA